MRYYGNMNKEESAGDIDELKALIMLDLYDLIPKHITKEDILASINYNMHLEYGMAMMMILTTLVTAVSARLENCSRISTGSDCPD